MAKGFLRHLGVRADRENIGSIIIVTGLSFEARIAGGMSIISDGARTAEMVRAAMDRGSRAVISFGVCGGLAPNLLPGQLVIASSVLSQNQLSHTDEGWSDRLLELLPGAKRGPVAGLEGPLTSAQERNDLYVRTGAVVADMESHLVAQLAAAHQVPFAVCRVVLNPAHRRLPPAALLKLREGGVPDLQAILASITKQPSQIWDLARLTIDTSMAVAALVRAKFLIGPDFRFPHPIQTEPDMDSQLLEDGLAPAA